MCPAIEASIVNPDPDQARMTLDGLRAALKQLRDWEKEHNDHPKWIMVVAPKIWFRIRHYALGKERGRMRHERLLKGKHGLKRPRCKRRVSKRWVS